MHRRGTVQLIRNTILYVDHVLAEIIRKLDRSGVPYVFIYLSDHGESLMEGGRMFHGTARRAAARGTGRNPLDREIFSAISIVERPAYHQQDVFDTVLDLLSIETTSFDKNRSFIKRGSAQR